MSGGLFARGTASMYAAGRAHIRKLNAAEAIRNLRIKPTDHRLAVKRQGNAASAGSTDLLHVAALPNMTPACGGGKVHPAPQRDRATGRAALDFHPAGAEARDNGRGENSAIPVSPNKALTQGLNKVALPGGKSLPVRPMVAVTQSPSTKSTGHIPASPATTMQRRKSANLPAPASLSGAGKFQTIATGGSPVPKGQS